MNRNGKIFIAILLIAAILIGAVVVMAIKSNHDEGEMPPEVTTPVRPNEEYVRTSTRAWSNNAWMGKCTAEEIIAIRFVDNASQVQATKAWAFDGISFYFNEGTVYVMAGKNLKLTGSLSYAFENLPKLELIDGFDRVDTSEVADMSGMFYNCPLLKEIDIPGIETDSVISADSMFNGCASLVEIDMSGCDMQNAITMEYIFAQCASATTIKLPKTRDVTSLRGAFECVGSGGAYSTITGTLNTSNCVDMSYMFNGSSLVDYAFIQEIDTSKLQNAEGLFCGSSIKSIDLTKWDMSNVQTVKKMFWSNVYLKSCDMTGWNMSSLKNCEEMFYQCTGLDNISLGWTSVNNIHGAANMFKFCFAIKSIDVTCFDGILIGDAREMFSHCGETTAIYSDGFSADVSDDMFLNCISLKNYTEEFVDLKDAFDKAYFTQKP